MNIPLLRRIQKQIAKEPRRLVMDSWVSSLDTIAPCHAAACLAGHAVLLSSVQRGETKDWALAGKRYGRWVADTWHRRAGKLLGLNSIQAAKLFLVSHWPYRFKVRYGSKDALDSRGRIRQAKVAIARIDHFIKTKGAE